MAKNGNKLEIDFQFSSLFEHIAIGLVMADIHGKLIDVNNPFCKLLGYSKPELLQMSFYDFTHPDDLGEERKALARVFTNHIEGYSIEKRYIRKDRKIVWARLSISMINTDSDIPAKYFGTVEDITLQKETQEKLEESRTEWKRIFQAIGHPSILMDKNHLVQEVNNAVIMSSGLKREEIIGMPCYKIFHNTHCESPPENCPMEALLKTKESRTIEMEMQAFNGRYLVSCTPLIGADGELKNIIHIATDITRLKNTEQELYESEVRYHSLLDSSPVGIAVYCDNLIAFANQKACDMFGISSPNMVEGRSIKEFIQLDNWLTTKILMDRALSGENELFPIEVKLIRPDKSPFYVQIYSSFIQYKGEKSVQIVFTDLNESRKAKESIQEWERRFTTIMKSVNLVSLILDKEGSILFCNQYLLTLTGYTYNEILGKNWFQILIPEEAKEEVKRTFYSMMHQEIEFPTFENEIITKEGKKLLILWNNTLLFENNNQIIGLACIGDNITSRKQFEDALLQKNREYQFLNNEYQLLNENLRDSLDLLQNMNTMLQEAKEKAVASDKLKTAFLQNMSHEIRTPLNAIMGFSDILSKHFSDKEKLIKYTSIIKQRGADLLDIINDILDIAKIESGQLPMHLEECNIENIFLELEAFFLEYKIRIQRQHIIVQFNIQDSVKKLKLFLDEGKLKQILINLISNALKFTSIGKVEVGCTMNNSGFLCFYVADTGMGIPNDKQSEIFDRFMQVNKESIHLYGGTGLGLSIVKGLLDLMGGSIYLESEVDKGSTFFFDLPATTPVP